MRILGIDPGSRLTGYGCVDLLGRQLLHVAHGTLHLSNTGGKATVPLEVRLHLLYQELSKVIVQYKPQVLAIEKVFFAKNAVSALKLGQARGAAILTGMIHSLEIVEYSPNEVKLAVVGQGHAEKEQVAKMVTLITGVRDFETFDASDGLALAICHAYQLGNCMIGGKSGQPNTELLKSKVIRRTKKGSSLAESLGLTPERVGNKRRIRL